MSSASARLLSGALALAALAGCSNSGTTVAALPNGSRAAIRITGSDTMINLVQALAETYRDVGPTSRCRWQAAAPVSALPA